MTSPSSSSSPIRPPTRWTCPRRAGRVYREQAWAFIPRKRQDRQRPLPMSWELGSGLALAVVLAVALLLATFRLDQPDVSVQVREFTFGMGAAAGLLVMVDFAAKLLGSRGPALRRVLYPLPGGLGRGREPRSRLRRAVRLRRAGRAGDRALGGGGHAGGRGRRRHLVPSTASIQPGCSWVPVAIGSGLARSPQISSHRGAPDGMAVAAAASARGLRSIPTSHPATPTRPASSWKVALLPQPRSRTPSVGRGRQLGQAPMALLPRSRRIPGHAPPSRCWRRS
jgi:hypothetical protein